MITCSCLLVVFPHHCGGVKFVILAEIMHSTCVLGPGPCVKSPKGTGYVANRFLHCHNPGIRVYISVKEVDSEAITILGHV